MPTVLAVRKIVFENGDTAAEKFVDALRNAGFEIFVSEADADGKVGELLSKFDGGEPPAPKAGRPTKDEISQRVTSLISDQGLTLSQVAQIAGVHSATVHHWRIGRHEITPQNLKRLERVERVARSLQRKRRPKKKVVVEQPASVTDDTKLEMAALREQGLHYRAIARRFNVPTQVAYLAIREVTA